MAARKLQIRTVTVALLVAVGTLVVPVAHAQPAAEAGGGVAPAAAQSDCEPDAETLPINRAFEESYHAEPGYTPFSESSNETTTDADSGAAAISLAVDSGGAGAGGVGELSEVTFARSWTAPCTGTFTFTATYDLDVSVEQTRDAGTTGNGVTKAEVITSVSVQNESDGFVTEAQANATDYASMIPTLSDLELDAVINVVSAGFDSLLGVPVGEFLLDEAGVERNSTDFRTQQTMSDQRVSVTFEAQEGATYTFHQQTQAAVIAVSIAGGGATGDLSVRADAGDAWITPGTEPPSHLGGSGNGGTEGFEVGEESVFVVRSTTEGPDFDYEFTVDGDAAPSSTSDVAADDEDRVIQNDDGTVTVLGSTGGNSGDAFRITGEILDFDTTAAPDAFALELYEDVTDEIAALDSSSTDTDGGDSGTGVVGDESTFVIHSTTEGPDFDYEFTVDGDAAPSSTSDVAADDEDRVIQNDDGTVTVVGSTGGNSGDAFRITGEILDFDTTADPGTFALELDGENVTSQLD